MWNATTVPGVLIVDDTEPVRKIIRRMLESNGYNVLGEAADGDEAIKLSIELNPDLIVMDYSMDKINGLEATRIIKKGNDHTKIVLLTGMPSPSLVMDSMRAGASNFVIKPVNIIQLLNVVRNAVGHREPL